MSDAPAISFRRLIADDFPLLATWLARPHVAEWWGPAPSAEAVAAHYAPYLAAGSAVEPWLVLADGVPVGYIQAYVASESGDGWWPDERDPGVRGIDQFLAEPALLGRGLGTAVVRAFVRRLFADARVTRVQVDPAPENRRAIRCYARAGFHAIGEVDTPDGRALLMVRERDEPTES